jgi:hypothetical protein
MGRRISANSILIVDRSLSEGYTLAHTPKTWPETGARSQVPTAKELARAEIDRLLTAAGWHVRRRSDPCF